MTLKEAIVNERKFGDLSSFDPTSNQALPLTTKEDKQWASLAHFGGILGCAPALVIYHVYKNRGPFTAQEAKEAFNFALPLTIVIFMSSIMTIFLPSTLSFWCAVVALVAWFPLAAYSIIGGIRSNRGQPYQYPFNLYFFSF